MPLRLKALGATLLLSGTMLGAGMLALPLMSAGMGFEYASIALFLIWALMCYTGLMLLEICLSFPAGFGFDAIARRLFGAKGSFIVNASLLLLLYSLSSAYISGGGSTYASNLRHYLGVSLSPALLSSGFTVLIGAIVCISTAAVDRVNRLLFLLNILVFLLLSITIQPYVSGTNLQVDGDAAKYVLAALPIFITAFGFHSSVPTMVRYLGADRPALLRNVFIAGSLIPLGVYLLWIFGTLGTLPRFGATSFHAISRCHGSVGMFLDQFHALANSPQVPTLLAAFSSIALFTSYLCVSLGLFDALASTLKRGDDARERIRTALVTYVPPFAFVLFFPKGFVAALGVAAVFLTILAVLFPATALIKLRQLDGPGLRRLGASRPAYRVTGGRLMHGLIAAAGLFIIVLQALAIRGQLPVF